MWKGKGARVTLARATFLTVFLAMHPIRSWGVTFHGQLAAQMYILLQTKGANLFHTILHFIFAWVAGVF